MDDLWQDAKHAARVLRKSPLFTLAVTGTVALGIGAATTIFALLNGVLLRPLPYPEPGRLALIWETSERMQQMLGYREIPASPMMAQLWRERASTLESVGFFSGLSQNFADEGAAERLRGARVTGGVFQALGVQPVLGRVISVGEEAPGQDGVIVLSHRLWKSRFQQSPQVAGRRIRVDD
jgi:putative ABC transport system permease protein